VLSTADGFQFQFETLAALKPDLIIGTNAGIKRGDYQKLSKIAPTIAHAKGSLDYLSPWDEQTALIAQALGKQDEGQALVKRVKDRYARRLPSTRSSRARPRRLARAASTRATSTSTPRG